MWASAPASGELDAQIRITDKLSIGGGLQGVQTRQFFGGLNLGHSQAVIARWEPIPELEVIPFWGREHVYVLGGAPYPIMACSCLPPQVDPETFYGQRWGLFIYNHTNYGLIAKATLPGDYKFQVGAFRSIEDKPDQNYNLYLNTNAQGVGDNYMVGFPPGSFKSMSGEVRIDKNFIIGATNNIFDLTFRARQVDRKFGGTDTKYLGTYAIGIPHPVPKPAFNYGPTSFSHATQETIGLNYQVEWKGIGQASVGVQKMFYSRKLDDPVRPDTTTSTQPWIMNASFAVPIGPAFALYGSFTQGLEEADEAPSNATNRGEAVPAIRTSQIDGGIRYKLTQSVSLVAGVFQVKKPYYSLDRTSTFAQLGEVRHRGNIAQRTSHAEPHRRCRCRLLAGAHQSGGRRHIAEHRAPRPLSAHHSLQRRIPFAHGAGPLRRRSGRGARAAYWFGGRHRENPGTLFRQPRHALSLQGHGNTHVVPRPSPEHH